MQYTAHYRLPLFESADHPSWLGDWNETMNKIDECISDLEIGNIPSLAGLIERIVALENSVEADEQIISATTQALTTLVKKSNITLDFDNTHSYTVGELCFYEGDLYKCVVAHTGDWLSTDFTRTTIEQQINDVASGITPDFTTIYQMFAPEFDETQRYMQGAMVMHQNALYVCSQMYDPDFPGADFNTCFTVTNVATQIASLVTSINAVRVNADQIRELICNNTFYPTTYAKGTVVEFGNDLYLCTQQHDASSYSYIADDPYFVRCGKVGFALLNMLDSIAPIFNRNQSYSVGDTVSVIDTYSGSVKFYVCKTSHTAGAWDFDTAFVDIPSPIEALKTHTKGVSSVQLYSQTGPSYNVEVPVPQTRYYKNMTATIKFKVSSTMTTGKGFLLNALLYRGNKNNLLDQNNFIVRFTSTSDTITLECKFRVDTILCEGQNITIEVPRSWTQCDSGLNAIPQYSDFQFYSGYLYY